MAEGMVEGMAMEGESRWMGQECHFFPLMAMLWICRTRVVLMRRKKEGTECVVLLGCVACVSHVFYLYRYM